jgi:hypothetical protein
VTEKYAAEVDFARKWAEGLGQALRYARLTGKRGALVLICGSYSDRIKAARAQKDINHYQLPIDVFPIDER